MAHSDEHGMFGASLTPSVGSNTGQVGSDSQESAAQLHQLVAHLRQAFWIKNAVDTAVLYVSPAYERIWGRSPRSLYDNSHTFLDSVHPDDRERVAAVMNRKQETEGYDEEYRIARPDGTVRWIWARTYPVRDEQGEITRYAGIAEDISERKLAEKERVRLAAIIELTDDAIVSITLEGIIIGWNQGAERKYGYMAEEVIGRSIFILIPADHSQEYLDTIEKVRKGETVPVYHSVRLRKDGTLINFSIGIAPIESLTGAIVGVSKIGHELTRVRKLEAQLIEAQKMAVVGQLTGGVAHDFNNILSIVLGYSELLQQNLKPDDPLQRFAAAICQAAGRGAGVIRQLLVFSRKETAQSATLNLNAVLDDFESMLGQLINENIELIILRGAQLGGVNADPGHIGQVLMNLVVNARDAMPSGGKIYIATSDLTLDEVYVNAHPGVAGGDYVMLSIRDTGIGIPDEIKAHLFKPFFTTKPRGTGTGLGLSTCQTIVQLSGGHIDVYSEAGHGTTISIYFPRVLLAPESATRSRQPGPLPRGTETLLVVEDDPQVRRLLGVALQTQGYTVLTASNGEEGLHTVLGPEGSAISLVISDVIMPRMGGREMAAELETRSPPLKFLFTSGHVEDVVALQGVVAPRIAFLAKPHTIAILASKVRELLDDRVSTGS